jgi:hypothetical protein
MEISDILPDVKDVCENFLDKNKDGNIVIW